MIRKENLKKTFTPSSYIIRCQELVFEGACCRPMTMSFVEPRVVRTRKCQRVILCLLIIYGIHLFIFGDLFYYKLVKVTLTMHEQGKLRI